MKIKMWGDEIVLKYIIKTIVLNSFGQNIVKYVITLYLDLLNLPTKWLL